MIAPKLISISAALLLLFCFGYLASGQEEVEAVLSGHAIVPLNSILTPPEDVPSHLQTSGKYTHPDSRRRDELGSISGRDRNKPRVKDVFLPVEGQPFQGFSGIKMLKDGTAVIITDLDIKDPDGVSRLGSKGPVFTFPFETAEGVDIYDPSHIVVLNDNNYGFSSGRTLGKNDDNEFILLEVGEFLK